MDIETYKKIIKKRIRNWILIALAGTIVWIMNALVIIYKTVWPVLNIVLWIVQIGILVFAIIYFIEDRDFNKKVIDDLIKDRIEDLNES